MSSPLPHPVPPGQGPAGRCLGFWLCAWCLLTLIHVTQAIWVSGGTAYPGELADGRFNQLILEHGHQALRGSYTWSSPGQFYPEPNTLGYSDTHAGTLPIYTALRHLHVSREEAWQGWFVVVTALNVYAALRLFRALRIDGWILGPMLFASAGSTTMVWLTGTHMQMLPVFPALLAWEQAVRWTDDRRTWRIGAGIGWLAWQFAAGPYSAFFALVIGAAVGSGRLLTRANDSDVPARSSASRNSRLFAGALILVGGALAFASWRVYAATTQAGYARPISEVIDFAPTLADWFSAAPVSLLYPAGWPGGAQKTVEHLWLAGFLPWFITAAGLILAWRQPASRNRTWLLALGLGAMLTVLFFTKWNAHGTGAWVRLAAWIEPLRAFRSSGRIAGLLQFALIGATGLVLTRWLAAQPSRLSRVGVIVLSILVAAENLAHHQPSTLKAVAIARTQAVVEAWQAAGDKPILAFAPGFTNQVDAAVHLDAWSAALQRHRVTINGYSGGVPPSHILFIWDPSLARATELVRNQHLSPDQVSWVKALSPAAERDLNFHRQPERTIPRLAGFALQPQSWHLSTPLETYEIAGRVFYQFTPPADVRFDVPDNVTEISIDVTMRAGSYDGSGHSDGVGLSWIVDDGAGTEKILARLNLNPRDHVAQRGVQAFTATVPPGAGRRLVLRVDPGPAGDSAWDWPLFGNLTTH